jgi:tRNA(Ser,Leu) C12 N-acetylase TAN1
MREWNVIVTTQPGWRREKALLGALNAYGEFHPSPFKDVCTGRVDDVEAFLEGLRSAVQAAEPWVADLGRVIPVEAVFRFTPGELMEKLKQAVAPLLPRLAGASFYVRLERRGMAESVASPGVERLVADHLFTLAEQAGAGLRVSFDDPDFIVCAETLGDICGVALISRALRERYPFVHVK